MEFRHESEMIQPAVGWLRSLGLITKAEFATPWGPCDLVGLSFRAGKVRERLRLGQVSPIGPLVRVAVLDRIPDIETGQAVGFGQLQAQYRAVLETHDLREALARLVADKFVVVTDRSLFQKRNGWAPLHKRLLALELKLSRVEEAFSQARNHLAFTDESFVGLPIEVGERVASSPRKMAFMSAGVGLVGISPSGCRILIQSARPQAGLDSVLQMHCVERFWRTYVRGT